jgi:hypothetical protein
MKPRIFIGSSTESLDVAYALQENLEHDANVTVWSQGVFKLSNNTLHDLVNILDNIDYGVFILAADDLIQSRNSTNSVTRDNVIFEFGLFIGKLGKDHVFYLIPSDIDDLHVPTDLIGITPGKYYSKREDNNLVAALGPFANNIRKSLKNFIYENLNDLREESNAAKKIAVEKPYNWEYLLLAELLEKKIEPIIRGHDEIERGLVFIQTKRLSDVDCLDVIPNISNDYVQFVNLFIKLLDSEMKNVIKQGIDGNPFDIKSFVEKIVKFCKELLQWEYRVHEIHTDGELQEIIQKMKGWSKAFLLPLFELPKNLRDSVKLMQEGINDPELIRPIKKMNLPLDEIKEVGEMIKSIVRKYRMELP